MTSPILAPYCQSFSSLSKSGVRSTPAPILRYATPPPSLYPLPSLPSLPTFLPGLVLPFNQDNVMASRQHVSPTLASPFVSTSFSSLSLTNDSAHSSSRDNTGDEREVKIKRTIWLNDEDPSLLHARRALWEDIPPLQESETVPTVPVVGVDAEMDEEEEYLDELAGDESNRAQPLHATLLPLPSCLRTSMETTPTLTSSFSSLSSTMSTRSVQFNDEAITVPTYSSVAYPRTSDVAVEKLTMREVVELRDVKTSIGVWSGKLSPDGTTTISPSTPTESAYRKGVVQLHHTSSTFQTLQVHGRELCVKSVTI